MPRYDRDIDEPVLGIDSRTGGYAEAVTARFRHQVLFPNGLTQLALVLM